MGVAPRVACFVAAILLYHLAPFEAAIWTTRPEARGLTLAPIALLLLAVAPSDRDLTLWPARRVIARMPAIRAAASGRRGISQSRPMLSFHLACLVDVDATSVAVEIQDDG